MSNHNIWILPTRMGIYGRLKIFFTYVVSFCNIAIWDFPVHWYDGCMWLKVCCVTDPVFILQEVERFLRVTSYFNHENVYFNKTKGHYCWLNGPIHTCLGSNKGRVNTQVNICILSGLKPRNVISRCLSSVIVWVYKLSCKLTKIFVWWDQVSAQSCLKVCPFHSLKRRLSSHAELKILRCVQKTC